MEREDPRGRISGVLRAVGGDRRDWDSGGHLADDAQRVGSLEGRVRERDADDRQRRRGRQHARQVVRYPGPGDHYRLFG